MRENRPYGSEGGEQRYCSPTPIGLGAHGALRLAWIPAYAGTTKLLLKYARLFALLRAKRRVSDFSPDGSGPTPRRRVLMQGKRKLSECALPIAAVRRAVVGYGCGNHLQQDLVIVGERQAAV